MRIKPYLIAEIGCNHMGDINIAIEMIKKAASCNVQAVKFQKRNPRECLTMEEYNKPHPVPENAYGNTYGEHRERLEFTIEQHSILKRKCEELGIVYSSSVWDLTSAMEIAQLNPDYIKIPSACNTNFRMLKWLLEHYDGDIQLSLGMTTHEEEKQIVTLFEEYHKEDKLILLSCTSGYPVPSELVYLYEITRLLKFYGKRIKGIGFSGHHLCKSIDVAAFVLGADYIERHFTLNRAWKGTDHKASLLPEDFCFLRNELDEVSKALQFKSDTFSRLEQEQRDKLKRFSNG